MPAHPFVDVMAGVDEEEEEEEEEGGEEDDEELRELNDGTFSDTGGKIKQETDYMRYKRRKRRRTHRTSTNPDYGRRRGSPHNRRILPGTGRS